MSMLVSDWLVMVVYELLLCTLILSTGMNIYSTITEILNVFPCVTLDFEMGLLLVYWIQTWFD